MRVLVADSLADASISRFEQMGFEVVYQPALKGMTLMAAMLKEDPEILVVRSTEVLAAQIQAGQALSLVIRAGAGVNTIDLPNCSARGVYVANCPGKNAIAVAELVMGLILGIDRQLADCVADLRQGQWNKKRYASGRGLYGRTLGLLGLGRIGSAVAKLAGGMGMTVVAWSRSLTETEAQTMGLTRLNSPLAVAKASDVLSVHLSANPATKGLVGKDLIDALKDDAVFINTSRASVVDEQALLDRLNAGSLWAGLDVYSNEPSVKSGPWTHPLASHPRVYGTHHIGASTVQAQEAVGMEVCRIAQVFRDTGRVDNCVNLSEAVEKPVTLVVRHLDRVGVLATVLTTLQSDGISVGTMENLIFQGDEAAVARIQLRGHPSQAALALMRKHKEILSISLL
jgi:D-3-phosphoglycerate dehydrogenase